jgi:hypothetical protein
MFRAKLRLSPNVIPTMILVAAIACGGSTNTSSVASSTSGSSSSGTADLASNAASGSSNAANGAASGAGGGAATGAVSGAASGSPADGGGSHAMDDSDADMAGTVRGIDTDATRPIEPPSLDCPNGCNTDASYPPMVALTTPMPIGDQTSPRKLYIENQCAYTVWTFAQPPSTLPNGAPLQVAPGQAFVLGWANNFSGRIWPRSGCTGAGGNLTCLQGNGPDTLAEFTLTAGMASDWYDISLVDGFTIPVGIIQMDAPWTPSPSYVPGDPLGADLECGSPICAVDLNPGCPQSQRLMTKAGDVWGCKNGQSAPDGHSPTPVTTYFKAGCPTSYTYPYDDPQSLFRCVDAAQNNGAGAKDYKVIFCPTQGSTPGFP